MRAGSAASNIDPSLWPKLTGGDFMSDKSYLALLGSILVVVFVWSLIHPNDLFTWFLEVLPALLGVIILAFTYPRFKLTSLVYLLITMHMIILMVGGHYTYAKVPLFDWIRDAFGLARNHYDRLGHFAQGFVPAILVREVLLRCTPLRRGKWLSFIIISICLAFSAFYELIEWRVSMATGSAADAFLGTQGDVWDTQEDMMMCLVGSITSLLVLSKLHDRFLNAMGIGDKQVA
jgi:putative membrane protein